MANFGSKWAHLRWGLGRWAFPSIFVSTVSGGATIVGQGVMTATIPSIPVFGQASIVGQGVLTGSGGVVVFGQATIVGQGLFVNFLACPRDAIVILYLVPRATIAVTMPVAFVTSVNNFNETLTCGVNTDTVPATGSLNTLQELSGYPLFNQ